MRVLVTFLCCCQGLAVPLALDGGVEQEIVVERWDNGRPKQAQSFAADGGERRLVRETTYFTTGASWVVLRRVSERKRASSAKTGLEGPMRGRSALVGRQNRADEKAR